jgi:hypothetical protein
VCIPRIQRAYIDSIFNAAPDNEVVDPISDGPGSSDEYVPRAEEVEETLDDEEEPFDPSDDDTPTAAKKPRKKKAPKGSLRKVVEEEHAKLASDTRISTGKRKEPPLTAAQVISSLILR